MSDVPMYKILRPRIGDSVMYPRVPIRVRPEYRALVNYVMEENPGMELSAAWKRAGEMLERGEAMFAPPGVEVGEEWEEIGVAATLGK